MARAIRRNLVPTVERTQSVISYQPYWAVRAHLLRQNAVRALLLERRDR